MADFPKLARIKQDDENMEKIHTAARRGQTELIRRLIASDISPTIPNKFGCTALHLACRHGHVMATRELAPVSDVSAMWHGQRPLHLAVLSGNQEVISILVEAVKESEKDLTTFLNDNDDYALSEIGRYSKDIQGQTALQLAIGLENTSMIHCLLNLGATVSAKDRMSQTAIMRTIEFDQDDTFQLLMTPREGQTNQNLRLDICDKQGESCLHWAIKLNRPMMAEALLEAGHDVNVEDADKVTPFLLAAYAGFHVLLETMLETVDQFLFQSAQFHNGIAVQPERLPWLPWADEANKGEVQKILQKKLDVYNKDRAAAAPAKTSGKNAGGAGGPIQVAPSAPIKRQ